MAALTEHSTLPLPAFDSAVKLLIVVAPYYRAIADDLIAGARAAAERAGATVDLIEVPGALEIPTAVAMAGRLAGYDGFVALGCVIRGETTHYETVCNDSSRGLTLLGLQGLCIGNGILTVENIDQAVVRAAPDQQDKGGGTAAAALHLIALQRRWSGTRRPVGFAPEDRDPVRLAGALDGSSLA